MNGEVVFEEESTGSVGNRGIISSATAGMPEWLVQNKFATDTKQAEKLLLGIAIGAFVLMVGVWLFVGGGLGSQKPSVDYNAFLYKEKTGI